MSSPSVIIVAAPLILITFSAVSTEATATIPLTSLFADVPNIVKSPSNSNLLSEYPVAAQ